MPRVRALPPLPTIEPARPVRVERFGGRPPSGPREPVVSSARLAMVLLMGTETMLFTGLAGVFVMFRVSSLAWPPPGQPYLPLAVTALNTVILLSSAYTMRGAVTAMRRGDQRHLRDGLVITALLGSTFLLIQGFEWVRLIGHGLTLSSSIYGATFYTLIGLHGVHVLAAVIWLLVVLVGSVLGRYSPQRHVGVEICGMYWYFVCALWPVLFVLVYLT